MKKSKSIPSKRGGYRPGSGRKQLTAEILTPTTVYIDEKTITKARKIGDGSVSAGIRTAVKAHKRG